jgi:predicted HicB family RNase H-like nuclease
MKVPIILKLGLMRQTLVLVGEWRKVMTDFSLDPEKLPKKLELDLSPVVEDRLLKRAAASGRSVDELILEILDKALHEIGD